ncbi:MAG: magnesium transporter [Cyclobacteriaceae bacterium]|nr:magnesium transporter [Cyclobacteriaceae bacterium SS2]
MTTTDNKIIDQYIKNHPDQAIGLIEDFDDKDIAALLEALPIQISAAILTRIVSFKATKVLGFLDHAVASQIISSLPEKKAGNLLIRCDKSIRHEILRLLKIELRESIEFRLNFSKDAVGSHMETHVVTFKTGYKIADCLDLVKSNLQGVGSQIYVLNDHDELVGYVQLKDLLADHQDRNIHSLIREKPLTLLPAMSVEDLLAQWESEFAQLPVVDSEGTFLGIVSKRSIIEYAGNDEIQRKPVFKAGSALSELYRIGFISLLGTAPESNLKNRLS